MLFTPILMYFEIWDGFTKIKKLTKIEEQMYYVKDTSL